MSSHLIDYKKVKKAYKLLSIFGSISKEGSISRVPSLASLILDYIKAFPGCNNMQVERYLFHKTKGIRTIQQSNVCTQINNLVALGYIEKIKVGITNQLYIGNTYYTVAETLSVHKKTLVYNEKENLDNHD